MQEPPRSGEKVLRGIPVSPVSLVTVGPGRDYRNLLHEDWESFSITLPPRLLEECVPGISDWTRDDFAPERSVIPLPAPLATKFHRLSRSLFPEVRPVGNFGDRLWLSERLWNEAIRDKTLGLIGQSIAIAGSIAPGQHPKRLRGYLLVERALSYLDAHDLGEDDTVAHLVEELRCGRRTLELAFRNVLGCSPRQYWMALRLNSVRRYLVRQGAGITVTEAAQREGFMHLGRFASQYYRLYGELPSTTLGRATDLRTSAL